MCGTVDVSGNVRCWELSSPTPAARPLTDQPLLVSGSATGYPTVYGIDTARRLWHWTSLSANNAALSGPVLVVLPTP